jgi:hypothetical protein
MPIKHWQNVTCVQRVGPQNMDTKNIKVDLEELEVEAGELDLKKIGLKIIKEATKEGSPVTNKMTKKKMFSPP